MSDLTISRWASLRPTGHLAVDQWGEPHLFTIRRFAADWSREDGAKPVKVKITYERIQPAKRKKNPASEAPEGKKGIL